MAKRVGIVGAAVTPFKAKWNEKTYYELAQMATREVVKDAGISIKDVDAVFYGIYNDIFERTAIPEHALHGLIGMQNKFGIRISTGGATGAYTISAAHAYVAAGRFKTALVLGVEKVHRLLRFPLHVRHARGDQVHRLVGRQLLRAGLGWTASDSYAEVVLAYMDEHPEDLKPEVTAKISSLLSQYVKTNKYAQRQHDQVTPEEVMNSRLVVYPFKELEICVYTEGAAALITGGGGNGQGHLEEHRQARCLDHRPGRGQRAFLRRQEPEGDAADHVGLPGLAPGLRDGGHQGPEEIHRYRRAARRLRPPARDQHGRVRPGAARQCRFPDR